MARALLAAVLLLLVAAPSAGADPTISGIAEVGKVLTATAGSPPPFMPTYQWRRCDVPEDDCADIDLAMTQSYTVSPADIDHTLRVRVTDLIGTVDSPPTAIVPPDNTTPPAIVGLARAGENLTALPGAWAGSLLPSFAYQWQRCGPGAVVCAPIAGAMSASYVLSDMDVGRIVRVVVTATNPTGTSASVASAPTAVVAPAPLVNLEPPAITGTAQIDRELTATPGRWTTSGPIDFLYRWLRCNADAVSCVPIPGATAARYVVRLVDVGSRLRARVTAIADAGSLARTSAATARVLPPAGAEDFTQSGVTPAGSAFMQPFPRVRIKGFYTASGAALQLVTVRGPKRARIGISCRGPSCTFRTRTRRAGTRLRRLHSLERWYDAGTVLQIRVTERGLIGKYTAFVIRAKRPPKRRDRCLLPGRKQPVSCLSGVR